MTVAQVGAALGLITGLSGVIGMFLGGFLGDRYGQRDKRWYLWIPALGCLTAAVPALYNLFGDNRILILVLLVPANIFSTMYLGSSIAMCHLLVAPGMRAMSSAILFFVLNMIGLGLGPLAVGALSDFYQPQFGANNLRYAMLTTVIVGKVLGPLCFWMGARSLRRDITRNQSLLTSP